MASFDLSRRRQPQSTAWLLLRPVVTARKLGPLRRSHISKFERVEAECHVMHDSEARRMQIIGDGLIAFVGAEQDELAQAERL